MSRLLADRALAATLLLSTVFAASGGAHGQEPAAETIATPEAGVEADGEPLPGLPRPLRPMVELGVDIRPTDEVLPRDYAAEVAAQEPLPSTPVGVREWPQLTYHWTAAGSRHYPLRFEQVNAERYGYGCRPCLQPAVSAAHFFGTIPMLPYLMAADCPRECQYTLGHYRPGSCNPWRRHRCPRQLDAAVVQGAAVAGLVFLLP